jgi:tetratricopeptide (TPR) repeat protein
MYATAHARLIVCAVVLTGCTAGAPTVAPSRNGSATTPTVQRAEALSFLGKPLYRPPIAGEARPQLEANLALARATYARNPRDADAIIWLGRRLAYLGEYREAIDMFTEGVEKHPDDPRMYRHRGHRFITTRQLNRAIDDLEKAAELVRGTPDQVEPDGAPNRFNVPVSTLQSNIWYHLALAYYLKHDFERALPAWRKALELSTNDDMVVASSDWLYMTLRRSGRTDAAAQVLTRITPNMRILENEAYHRRLLMYKGLLPADSLLRAGNRDAVQVATYGYGVANWHLYNGDRYAAETLFRRILEGTNWAAFGFIAAEAELAGGGR